MPGPLDGIRVLNWSQFTPSSAGYILGDLGADVIKIEHPVQGDAYRGMGTMYGSAMSMKGGRHAGFEAVNRNQRSMTLDLKQDEGREILYQLVARCDVFFTNYTRRVAKDLQADYKTLSAKKPDLIYAVSSTYGPEGPWVWVSGPCLSAAASAALQSSRLLDWCLSRQPYLPSARVDGFSPSPSWLSQQWAYRLTRTSTSARVSLP